MFNLVICGVFKNEAHILEEWIQHYLLRRVDHIFLVNDGSTDNYQEILDRHVEKVTCFNNEILNDFQQGKQPRLYEKYFRPILSMAKWMAILDLDEFLYSPETIDLLSILKKYSEYSQIKVDWLHFGSNDHKYQPISVVNGFTKRAPLDRTQTYYSYKCLFQCSEVLRFEVHTMSVAGPTLHIEYNENSECNLVINHYTIQSLDFFMRIKATRGDVNNWFNTQGLLRDRSHFDRYDINIIEDERLFNQNKMINLANFPETDDVTLVITSCNRPHLLERTLASFVSRNTYPIIRTFIIDDSGIEGCNDKAIDQFKEILNITSIYNKKNIGQVESIDKVYSYVRTKWLFHCEEDWVFLRPGFIEKSMKVFTDNPSEKIYTVWLRPHSSTSGHPIIKDNLNRGYYLMKKDSSYTDKGIVYTWGDITFNPGLRKTKDCLLHHPYFLSCDKMVAHGKEYVGEYMINKKYVDSGYFSYILDEPNGHVDHIG